MEDLVDAVGVDAARYALARSSVDAQIDVDLDLLVKRSNDNPVYYVQYAHARLAGIVRNAAEAGVRMADAFEPVLLDHDADAVLLARARRVPADRRAGRGAARAAPGRALPGGARRLFHKWYESTRVTPRADEPVTDAHRTRLWLAEATRTVLENGLGLLGVSAPDRM